MQIYVREQYRTVPIEHTAFRSLDYYNGFKMVVMHSRIDLVVLVNANCENIDFFSKDCGGAITSHQ